MPRRARCYVLLARLLWLGPLGQWPTAASAADGAASCPNPVEIKPCSGPPTGADHLAAVTLPSVYQKSERPGCGNRTHRGATLVEVQLYLTQLNAVNEKLGLVTVNGYFRQWWKDPRLAFNGTAHGGCFDNIDLSADTSQQIWMPDLYIDNLFKYEEKGGATLTSISPDGSIWRSEQILVTVKGSFDLGMLPYDRHTAALTVASYSQPISNLRVTARGGQFAPGLSGVGLKGPAMTHAIWEFTEGLTVDSYETPGNVQVLSNWDYVSMELHFKRKPKYYMNHVIYPAVVFTLISYAQFFIDPNAAPARATLAVIPVLIMRTMSNSVYQSLPQGSQSMWLDDILYALNFLVCFGCAEFAVVEFCTVMEKKRAAKLEGLKKVRATAEQLLKIAEQTPCSLLHLLDECESELVELDFESAKQTRNRPHENVRARRERSITMDLVPVSPVTSSGSVSAWPQPQDKKHFHKKKSEYAKQNEVRESDLIFIRYASDIFNMYDRSEPANDLSVAEFMLALRHFNIYINRAHTAKIVGMFLRDEGEATLEEESQLTLSFMQFTKLLLQIEHYTFDKDKHSRGSLMTWRCKWESMSPSRCCDVFARIIYPVGLVCIFVIFYGFMAVFWSQEAEIMRG